MRSIDPRRRRRARRPDRAGDGPRASRRAALGTALAAGAALVLPGCGAPAGPAAAPATPATWRDPFGARFTVVVDPGHGGNDSGTRAANGLLEKDLTLDIARRLREQLVADDDGFDVRLTRERDVWLSREARVAAVRAADADLLLSLHFNILPERDIALVETYYAHASNIVDSRIRRRASAGRVDAATAVHPEEPNDVSFTRGSERFAALVQRHVFEVVEQGNAQAVDAGVKRDTLFVLTRGATSGALVELTCVSNAREAERLMGDAYRERLAAALATAVRAYRDLSNLVVPVELDM